MEKNSWRVKSDGGNHTEGNYCSVIEKHYLNLWLSLGFSSSKVR